jgi:pheromone shutdown protein TraB
VSAPTIALLLLLAFPLAVRAETANSALQQGQEVIQQFIEREQQVAGPSVQELMADIKRKQRILFLMGLLLLLTLFTTLALGLAMALYNKPVFVAHMVFAGITATLALAHAVVAVVWFYPF